MTYTYLSLGWKSPEKMHLSKPLLLITILTLLSCATQKNGVPRGYDATPALLHASVNKQADTIGFNLVSSLAELLYPRILVGDIPLWETSSKKRVVGALEFQQLEKKATSPFVTGNDLFIHEYWQIFKQNYDFTIQGFAFAATSKTGGTLNYGYIDGKDVVELLKTRNISTNVNGVAEMTYWDALHTKKYDFNLVQFGAENFENNGRLSAALQYQAIYDPSIFREFHTPTMAKRIRYKVLPPSINLETENKALYAAVERAVNDNKQTVLNAGGDEFFSHTALRQWKITTLIVDEHWTQYKNVPLQSITRLQLFIDGHSVILNPEQLAELNIKVNMQGLEEYLSEKQFDFLLENINDQEIQPKNSQRLYNALLTKPWDRISN